MKTFDMRTIKERALERAMAEQVRPIKMDATHYAVASVSQPGVAHEVIITGTRIACDCAGFFHITWCKHAAAVEALVEMNQERVILLCADCRTATVAFGSAWYAGLLCHLCGHDAEEEQRYSEQRDPFEGLTG